METNKDIDYTTLDYGRFKRMLKEFLEDKKPLQEKDKAEIDAEKEEMKARVEKTDAQIKARQKKLPILKKAQAQANQQKPYETGN